MKKAILKAGLTVVAAIGLVVGAPAFANATNLYNDTNFVKLMWSGSSSPGGLPAGYNDQTTSFTNSGVEVYCENWNCSGRKLTWSGNANALGSVATGLGFGETWSDRISSVQ